MIEQEVYSLQKKHQIQEHKAWGEEINTIANKILNFKTMLGQYIENG